jgi:hypothetical protein
MAPIDRCLIELDLIRRAISKGQIERNYQLAAEMKECVEGSAGHRRLSKSL